MSIIINLHHGRTKIVRNRVGGDGPHHASQERRGDKVYLRQLVDRMLDRESREEIDTCLSILNEEGSLGVHPHDVGLPDLSLVRHRLNHGDVRNGLTTVLNGALGVAQFGKRHIEMPILEKDRIKGRRNRRGQSLSRISLTVGEDGFMTSAICR